MKRRSPGEGSIFRRPDGRWVGQIVTGHDSKGRARRRTVYGKTRGEVVRKLQEAQKQAGLGPVDRRATLHDVTLAWLAARKPRLRASTEASYRRVLLGHLGPFGRQPVARITAAAIEAHLARLRDAKLGGRVVQYHRQLLRSVLRYAVRRGIIATSPADAVESFAHRRQIPDPWTPGEATAFLQTAIGSFLYPFFHLALSTGMRLGELLGLQWSDLDPAGGTVTVRHARPSGRAAADLTEPKTARSRRTITLDEETVAVLTDRWQKWNAERNFARKAGLWKGSDDVFAGTDGRPLSRTRVRDEFNALAAAAGVRRIRLHDLRHTYATMALRAGLQVHVVSERLGHSRASITLDIYAGVLQEQRAAAALPLTALLGRETASKQHSAKTN